MANTYSVADGLTNVSYSSASTPQLIAELQSLPVIQADLRFLKVIEASKPSGMEFEYLLFKDKSGLPVAFVFLQHIRFNPRNFNLESVLLKSLLTLISSLIPLRLTIIGNAMAVDFPGIRLIDKSVSINELMKPIRQFQKRSDAILIKDLSESFTEPLMLQSGFQSYKKDLTMELRIDQDWKVFNDYKKTLTKKYRKRLEKIEQKGKDLTRKELELNEIEINLNIIEDLFNQVTNKQTIRLCVVDSSYFINYKKEFRDLFKFIAYYKNDQMIAFATYVDRGERLELHYIGIDYRYNDDFALYFNILYDGVKAAIEEGKKLMELGRTAREAKASLGCQPVYFNDYFAISNRAAEYLFKLFSGRFEKRMGEEWKNRKPFKSETSNI